ncbi:MAG: hypothetical protein ACREQ4_18820 [Candidatus Binataceae bacterium]
MPQSLHVIAGKGKESDVGVIAISGAQGKPSNRPSICDSVCQPDS